MPRIEWDVLPASVRAGIEVAVGARVVSAVNQESGFTPSLAARCELDDGRVVFLKAVSAAQNPDSPGLLRQELRIGEAMPHTVAAPPLLTAFDDEWVAGAWAFVEGRQPAPPWTDDLRAIFGALRALAEVADPSPIDGLPLEVDQCPDGWVRLAADPPAGLDDWSRRNLDRLVEVEGRWREAVAGTALLHHDVRADNLVVDRAGRVWFTDWASAAIGAPWLDALGGLPATHLAGGPAPEAALALAGTLAGDPDPDAVTTYVVAVAGYFTEQSLRPPPPGIPTVRAFQAAQGEVARAWVASRTGWT